jgi:hypothetical protein
MKKYFIFLIPLFIWGCSTKFNNVIDPVTVNYQVTNVSSFSDVTFKTGDSISTFSISVSYISGINSIFFDIMDPDNNQLNTSPVFMFDDGLSAHGDLAAHDSVYSNTYSFSQKFVNGKYSVKYYIADNNGTTLAAVQNFNYNNNQLDIPPVISHLIVPDTLTQQDTSKVLIVVSVTAYDSNGRSDIQSVFYYSYKPDGTIANSGNPIYLFDNGDPNNGDAVAGDGIYSAIVELPAKNAASVPKGTYRWEFQARDREGILSNKIIHNVVIK